MSSPAVPDGWRPRALADLATIQKGTLVPTNSTGRGVPYLGAESLEGPPPRNFTESAGALLVEPSDVLMLWDGERSGLCGVGLIGAAGSTLARLRVKSGVLPRFLYWMLKRQFGHIQAHRTGTGVPHVPKDLARFLTLVLPEDPREQRRIADILDAVDDAIRSTKQVIAKLEQIKQGLVHDLLTRGIDESGELQDPSHNTGMFHKRGRRTHAGWITCELDRVVDPGRPIVYGILMPGYGFAGGVPVVKVKNIKQGQIKEEDLLLTDPRIDNEYRRSRIQAGDLLFSIRGTVGRMAFVPSSLAGANITQDTARIAITGANARYVVQYLQTPLATTFIELHTLGQAVKGINLRDVRRIPLLLPPRSEQDALADILDAHDARIQAEQQRNAKFQLLKQGLMADLLSGRVRVNVENDGTA